MGGWDQTISRKKKASKVRIHFKCFHGDEIISQSFFSLVYGVLSPKNQLFMQSSGWFIEVTEIVDHHSCRDRSQ